MTVAETAAEGVRLGVGGERVPPPERATREAELRARACAGCARPGCSGLTRNPRAARGVRPRPAKDIAALHSRVRRHPSGTPMSHSQRTRRRRSHRGSPRNKAFLGLHGAGDRRRDRRAGIAAVGYVVSIAASAPPLSSLKRARPGQQHARSSPPTARRSASSRPTTCACPLHGATRSRRCSRTRRSRSRTSASTSTRASTTRASSAPACKNLVVAARPCRAARRSRCSSSATSTSPASAPTSARSARPSSREELEERALQGVDPRQVPQHGPLRHRRRPVGDRRQGRRADLLQQARSGPDAARGRDARRPAAGAVDVLAACAARAPPRRAATRCCARWPSSG